MIRQCLLWLVLFSFATSSANLAADPAAPPTALVAAPIHYADQAVVVSTAEGVAIIRFTDAIPEGRKYVYRFLATGAAQEEKGEGKVFEKYDRKPAEPPPDGVVELTDAGGQLEVVAGKLGLEWSIKSEDTGWLYFVPEDGCLQVVSTDDFEKVKLARFAK